MIHYNFCKKILYLLRLLVLTHKIYTYVIHMCAYFLEEKMHKHFALYLWSLIFDPSHNAALGSLSMPWSCNTGQDISVMSYHATTSLQTLHVIFIMKISLAFHWPLFKFCFSSDILTLTDVHFWDVPQHSHEVLGDPAQQVTRLMINIWAQLTIFKVWYQASLGWSENLF